MSLPLVQNKIVTATTIPQPEDELYSFYREHPYEACKDLLRWRGKPIKLAPHQRLVLKDFWTKQFLLMMMTRGGGKTFLLGLLGTLSAMLIPYTNVAILSRGFRQAKLVFSVVEQLWRESEFLQHETSKRPTREADQCYLPWLNGSNIYAFPLGDGDKIRGVRAHVLIMDEYQLLDHEIVNTVILPTAGVKRDVWDDEEGQSPNKLVMSMTATWKFDDAYKTYLEFLDKTNNANDYYDPTYAFHCYTIDDMPRTWYDWSFIKRTMDQMSEHERLMEYYCKFIDDTFGFYPASLLKEASLAHLPVQKSGVKNHIYTIGVDPARTSAYFTVVVQDVVSPTESHVVYAVKHRDLTYPKMVEEIRNTLRKFPNTYRLVIDAGGGGLSLKDQLAMDYIYTDPKTGKDVIEPPILDVEDKTARNGLRILRLFSNQSSDINKANFDMKNFLERAANRGGEADSAGRLYFAGKFNELDEEEEQIYYTIQEIKKQMTSIKTTPLKSGLLHFDTEKSTQYKDLYSAVLFATSGFKEYLDEHLAEGYTQKLAEGFVLPVELTPFGGLGLFGQ